MAIGKDLVVLCDKIDYRFSDLSLLENALTHSSFANERRSRGNTYPSNERLEFLGDAVLQITVSEYLYSNFKSYSEGSLTKVRQNLVCEKTLSKIALSLELGDFIHLGRGEELTDCRKRPKLLADTFEAFVGAIYLDSGGFSKEGARDYVLSLFATELLEVDKKRETDYKTALQQLVEKDGMAILEYRVIGESGPEHNKIFTVEAVINNNVVGCGTAGTKKEAEMLAAGDALKLFGVNV